MRSTPPFSLAIRSSLQNVRGGAGAGAQCDSCTYGDIGVKQSGLCHLESSNEECSYDGGDCCECIPTDEIDLTVVVVAVVVVVVSLLSLSSRGVSVGGSGSGGGGSDGGLL